AMDQPWGHVYKNDIWHALQVDNPAPLGPAGRVHCQITDWLDFLRLQLPLYAKKNVLLNDDQLQRLIIPNGDYAAGWIVGHRPWAQGITLWHNGSNTTWYTNVWIAPKIDRIFLVALNSYNDQSAQICDEMIGQLINMQLGN
ncbi:MAG: penicillin-binding protein, partial [Planctomycetes bacterium]|nr:penicillin-binding protein [Planctomycetota bacterium]